MQNDHTAYIIVADYGKHGKVYSETEIDEAGYDETLASIMRGEPDNPIKVIAFNEIEGWSKDASREIAEALANIYAYRPGEASQAAIKFCGLHDFELP